MKLSTVLLASAVALGSTAALADHRHKQGHSHAHHKHHGHCAHRLVVYEPVEYGHGHPSSNRHRRVQDYARVVNVEPVYHHVREPAGGHSCLRYDRRGSAYTSHTATVLGAVIGGALGHRVGDAHGDPNVAAIAGGLLGASLGRDVDRRASYARGLRVEGPCGVSGPAQTRRELLEYAVTYRYNGRLYHTRMDYDPGEWIRLDASYTPT